MVVSKLAWQLVFLGKAILRGNFSTERASFILIRPPTALHFQSELWTAGLAVFENACLTIVALIAVQAGPNPKQQTLALTI